VISSDPSTAGLLKPPRIEDLDPEAWIRDGQLNVLIQVWTSGDFGILGVYVTIRDAEGNIIESGYALQNEIYMNHWGYIIEVDAGDYRTLTVQALVLDRLGGIGLESF
jgi:hypothetical protein